VVPVASLPIPPSLRVEALLLGGDGLTILASSAATDAPCPLRGRRSGRVHSRSGRALADLPWADVAVRVRVRVRKSFRDNDACPRAIFAERLVGVAQANARRTDRQRAALTAIAVALGGEAGARLALGLGMPTGPDTLLRLIRGAPGADLPAPTVLGVDDWAIHQGLTYGTILVDLERPRPVGLLPDRSGAPLAAWLRAHPGVEIIARDRAGAYAEGARAGAPEAVQVADRWHLVANLADALEDRLRAKGTALKAAAATLASQVPTTAAARPPPDGVYQGKRRHPQPERWRERQAAAAEAGVARRRANYEQARALRANGASVAQIARTVGIARMAVYRYLRDGPPQRKRPSTHGRQRVLEPYEPSLLKRWEEGCRMATRLWREIQTQGVAHSLTDVQRFVDQPRREGPPPAGRPRTGLTKPDGPPPRQVAAIVPRRPERRTDEQRAYPKQPCAEDAAIAAAVDLAADFLVMLRRREGERLPAWLAQAAAGEVPALARFAAKLRADLAAVRAGLTLRHSNGQTEGRLTRLKPLKRQGDGRAKVDLLRQRVLRAA
jgi:transposase